MGERREAERPGTELDHPHLGTLTKGDRFTGVAGVWGLEQTMLDSQLC